MNPPHLPANHMVRVAALAREKGEPEGSADSVSRAASVRGTIKRVTDAYTRGALGEGGYREKLRDRKDHLERLDTAPDGGA
ncbi:MAG TPA: hypothetical protein VGS17_08625 [Candidatus Limnocylindria bacterium]|nr:hypothetical protein [Candidatus Limnocylindria bacterium]